MAPCTNPSRVPATTRPATPPITMIDAMTADKAQWMETPIEQSTATTSVSSSTDRKLN